MQADLEKVYEWVSSSNMAFNAGKFELLRYRAAFLLRAFCAYLAWLSLLKKKLMSVTLALLLTSDATFKQHKVKSFCFEEQSWLDPVVI